MGKHDNDVVRQASEHVFALFRSAPPDNPLVYHGFKRTRELVGACKDIAKGVKLENGDVEPLLLAAWFHDAGYAVGLDGDVSRSAELLHTFLEKAGEPPELREAASASLAASQSNGGSASPRDEVLRDALLTPLASENYIEDAELLRLELERRKGKLYSDVDWTQECISFLENHQYRTRYAQLEYNGGRTANLVRLHKILRRQVEEAAEQRAEQAKVSKGVGKTVESVFYYLTKIQVGLVALADRRTSRMIHVNAIMISIVIGLLLRRLESERYLIVPTLFLLTVNLVAIFVSIYSMRSARSSLAREEAQRHEAK